MIERVPKKSDTSQCRRRIVFQQAVQTPDGEGGFSTAWVNFLPRWASVVPIRADQQFEYKSVNVDATHHIKTRGYLTLPTFTKWEGATWAITWAGIAGTNVQIHYQINGGSWVLITASTPNDGAYSWTIPAAAIGENVVVRVMHATLTNSYQLTDAYLVVDARVINREANETDRIYFDSRVFEILTMENLHENDFKFFITCKERR